MISFAAPLWLLALPLPWLALWLMRRGRLTRRGTQADNALIHPHAELLGELAGNRRAAPPPWLWLAGSLLLIVALAQPQRLRPDAPPPSPGHNIMVAVDVSGSMRALDYRVDGKPVSRLDMVKRHLPEFIAARAGDRLGLIAFADDAMTYIPLTTDHALFTTLLAELHQGLAGERTALGDAMALGITQLQATAPPRRDQASRILILFTDGSNTAGTVTPDNALLLARQQQVRIYTVGIGSDATVAFPRGPVLDPVATELPVNEDLLRHIAKASGGRYYLATAQRPLAPILEDIDDLEQDIIDDRDDRQRYDNLFWLPLLSGLLLLLGHQWRQRTRILPCPVP